jgi:murein DD-endopeptidase MepM/ murein hydrolase activator NlpD
MKLVALALSAFAGLPNGPRSRADAGVPTFVGWGDSWSAGAGLVSELGQDVSETWLLPEAPAQEDPTDEVAADPFADVDPDVPTFPYVFSGCELTLGGNQAADAWARDLWLGAPAPRFVEGGHTDKEGRWVDYEQIPRRPERPEEYAAYRYPVVDAPVVSGYDLDKPDDDQRRGHMNAVGHGGVDLMAPMGTPIKLVRLEHQLGDAEVLYVGSFYGETVITRHTVREGGAKRDYVLIFGHLDRPADDVRRGRRLREGALVGYVGNTSSPELVHLHLEARRVKNGVDAWKMPASVMLLRENTVVSDPRNVLPLRQPRMPMPRCKPRWTAEPRTYWLGTSLSLRIGEPDAVHEDEVDGLEH